MFEQPSSLPKTTKEKQRERTWREEIGRTKESKQRLSEREEPFLGRRNEKLRYFERET
jgi:hypothetical protein